VAATFYHILVDTRIPCVRIDNACTYSYPGITVGGIGGFTIPESLQLGKKF
jgi:hypothetical protein